MPAYLVASRGQLGYAKVQHLDEVRIVWVLAQEDVGRLQIAVDHAVLVSRAHGRGDLGHDLGGCHWIKRAGPDQSFFQGLAFQ